MNRFLVFILALSVVKSISNPVKAQSSPPPQPVKMDAFPPTPTAASLGKFADIPVGLNNGTPSINIPIWTVKEGDIELPIALNYHARGIQVAELASWVGLGWALDAGGLITRSVRGLPDDKAMYGFLDKFANPMPSVSDPTPVLREKYMYYANGDRDSQPDLFSFNFAGRTGKFQMDQDGNIYVLPFQKISIVPTWSDLTFGRVISKWTVVTEDGFKYEFNNREVSRTLTAYNGTIYEPRPPFYVSSWYLSKITSPIGSTILLEYETPYTVPLYSIGSFDTYYFPVSLTGGSSPSNIRGTLRTEVNEGVRLKRIKFTSGEIEFVSTTNRCDIPGEKMLDVINVKNAGAQTIRRFVFSYNGVSCPYGTTAPATSFRPMLLSVQETDGTGAVTKPPHSFTYFPNLPDRLSCAVDDWGFYNGQNSNIDLVPSVKIGTVYESGANKEVDQTFACYGSLNKIVYPTGGHTAFTYELHDADRGYPKYTKKEVILNGDDAGAGAGKLTTGPKQIQFSVSNTNPSATTSVVKLKADQCPCVSPSYTQPCTTFYKIVKAVNGLPGTGTGDLIWSSASLKLPNAPTDKTNITINMPDGFYFLVLESSRYPTEVYYPQLEMKVTVLETVPGYNVGGLRIKKMEDYDPIASKTTTKFYSYVDTLSNSSGRLLWLPKYGYDYYQNWVYNVGQPIYTGTNQYYVRTSSPNTPMTGLTSGSHISYGRVVVDLDEINTVVNPNYPLPLNVKGVYGKSIHKFTTLETALQKDPNPVPDGFPFSPGNSMDWISGDLLETIELRYDNSNGHKWYPVKQTRNKYVYYTNTTNPNYRSVSGLKVGLAKRGFNTSDDVYATLNFQFSTGYKELVETSEMTFDQNDATKCSVKKRSFEFGTNHLQQIKSSVMTSDGKLLTTFSIYPSDYADNTGFIKSLKLANIWNVPIERVTYTSDVDGISNIKVLSGEITTYQDNQKGLLDEVFTLEVNNPIPLSDFRFSNMSTTNVIPVGGVGYAFYRHPSRYASRLKYNTYDATGNVVQYTQDGFPTSFLWGYNSTLPIAKALNATGNGNVADVSQIAYNGYETGTLTGEVGWENVTEGSVMSKATEPSNVFAGKYAHRMGVPAAGYTSYSSILNLYPSPQKGRYKMGCWVRTAPGFVVGQSTIEMYAIKRNTAYAKYPVSPLNAARFVIPNTNDKWQYFEVVFDFDAVKALVPTEELSIRCYTASRSTTPVYIDEVRICPLDAQMTTLTYEPLIGPTSITAPDNSAEVYEYDGLGRLKLVKDHAGNILKSYSYKYKGQ